MTMPTIPIIAEVIKLVVLLHLNLVQSPAHIGVATRSIARPSEKNNLYLDLRLLFSPLDICWI